MLRVDILMEWANAVAIGKSNTYPDGWVSGENLQRLAEAVIDEEPLPARKWRIMRNIGRRDNDEHINKGHGDASV